MTNARWAMSSLQVYGERAAGKGASITAFASTENASQKISSCAPMLRTRKEKPAGGFWIAVKVVFEG